MKIIDKIKGFFKRSTPDNPKLKLVYESKNGKKWFTFYNPIDMPYKRAIQAESATRYAELAITRERLILLSKQFLEAVKKGDYTTVAWLAVELNAATATIAEEQTLLELAACYIVGENENLFELTDQTKEQKINEWSRDAETINFFLELAWTVTKQYGEHSQIDILNYLKKVRKNIRYRSMHSTGFKDSVLK